MAGSSNNDIPYDVMIDILKRVPVKSLFRFISVSKDWSKLIKTPHFIKHHLHHSLQNPFLLLQRVHYLSRFSSSTSFCLIGPYLKVHNSRLLDFISDDNAEVVGSCNGLLCLRHTDGNLSICNPATMRFTEVPRTLIDTEDFYFVGFGFSSIVNDYKIVRVSVCYGKLGNGVLPDRVHVSRVEVYSLVSGSWREIDASSLHNLSPIANSVAVVDGALFWKSIMNPDDGVDFDEYVVSFDIEREMFTLLKGPPAPPAPTKAIDELCSCRKVLTVYNNKIARFHCFVIGNFEGSSFDLWVLDNTDTFASDGERWIKQNSFGPFSRMIHPQSIWRDEIVCQEELYIFNEFGTHRVVVTALSLFNPCSNEFKNLPSLTKANSYGSFSYAESLVQVPNIQLQN